MDSGWAYPALLQDSFFLHACGVQALGETSLTVTAEASLHSVPTAAMTEALALNMPEPCPSMDSLFQAGAALHAYLEQQPLPTCPPCAIFGGPYIPAISALPLATLLLLLRVCDLAALPAPTTDAVTACLAQRYASQPAAVFEAEVGTPSPRCAALALQWWERRLGLQQPCALPCPSLQARSHTAWALSCLPFDPALPLLPPTAFGLTACAPELWVRGLDCVDSPSPPPCTAALLALTFGHTAWAQRTAPAAAASAAAVLALARSSAPPAARGASLLALLTERGMQDAALAQLCCGALWHLAVHQPQWHSGSSAAGASGKAVVEALLAHHEEDASVVHSAVGYLCAIGERFHMAAVLQSGPPALVTACLSALAAVLGSPYLDAASAEGAAASVRSFLSSQPASGEIIEAVVAAGCVPSLVQLLQWEGSPQVQLEAAWALTNISSGTSQHASAVIEAGALPPLVHLLHSPSPAVQEQAVWALGNLAGDCLAARLAVLEAGVVPALLQACTPHSKHSLMALASWAMKNLVRSEKVEGVATHPPLASVLPLLPALAALAGGTEDEEALKNAMWALSYLSDGEEGRQLAVVESGCLPRMVALLGHASGEVALPALCAVNNLATGEELVTQAVLNAGTLPAVVALLLPGSPHPSLFKDACFLLSNVCAGTQGQIQAVLAAGCLPVLLHHASKGSPEVAKEASWALCNAVLGCSAAQAHSMATEGLIEALHAMLLDVQQLAMQHVAIEGLQGLLSKQQQAPLQHSSSLAPEGTIVQRMQAVGVAAALHSLLLQLPGSDPRHTMAQALLAQLTELAQQQQPPLEAGCLVSASWDKTVRVWGAGGEGACLRVLTGHTRGVLSVCSLGQGRLASGSMDCTVRLWLAASGLCERVLQGHTDSVAGLCTLEGGRLLVSASGDRTLRLWSPASGECVRVLRGHTGAVMCVCALQEEGLVVSGATDRTLRVWSAATGKGVAVLRGHREQVNGVCALDGGLVASCSSDNTLRLWRAATGEGVRVLAGHEGPVRGLCAIGAGHLASGSFDTSVRVWDLATGACVRAFKGLISADGLLALGDRRLALACNSNSVLLLEGSGEIWDPAAQFQLRGLPGHTHLVAGYCLL